MAEIEKEREKNVRLPRVFLYGLDQIYRIVHYTVIPVGGVSIGRLFMAASWLRRSYPGIRHVFAVDNSPSIYDAYRKTIKQNTIDEYVLFKILLEQLGMKVI